MTTSTVSPSATVATVATVESASLFALPPFPGVYGMRLDLFGKEVSPPRDGEGYVQNMLLPLCPFLADADPAVINGLVFAFLSEGNILPDDAARDCKDVTELFLTFASASKRYSEVQRSAMIAARTLLPDYLGALFAYATGAAIPPVPELAPVAPTEDEAAALLKKFGALLRNATEANYDIAKSASEYLATYLACSDKSKRSEGVRRLCARAEDWLAENPTNKVNNWLAGWAVVGLIGDGAGIDVKKRPEESKSYVAPRATAKKRLPWETLLTFAPLIELVDRDVSSVYRFRADYSDLFFVYPAVEGKEGAPGTEGYTLTFAERCKRLLASVAHDGNTRTEARDAVGAFLMECKRRKVEIADRIASAAEALRREADDRVNLAVKAEKGAAEALKAAISASETATLAVETADDADKVKAEALAQEARTAREKAEKEAQEARDTAAREQAERARAEKEKSEADQRALNASIALKEAEEKAAKTNATKGTRGTRKDTTPSEKVADTSPKAPTLDETAAKMAPKQLGEYLASLLTRSTDRKVALGSFLGSLCDLLDDNDVKNALLIDALLIASDVLSDTPEGRAAVTAATKVSEEKAPRK